MLAFSMDGKWKLSGASCRFMDMITASFEWIRSVRLGDSKSEIFFFFVEPDLWDFFNFLKQERNLPYHFFMLTADMIPIRHRLTGQLPNDHLAPGDVVGVIGRPAFIERNLRFLNQKDCCVKALCLPVPVLSHNLKIGLWKYDVLVDGFMPFGSPFMPRRRYVHLPIGTFRSLFISQPTYETKAMQAALASLHFSFGKFERVYAVGEFSSMVCTNFLDAMAATGEGAAASNILVMVDRTVDMAGIVNCRTSYLSCLEELELWDAVNATVRPESMTGIFRSSNAEVRALPVFGDDDEVFGSVALMTLTDVLKKLEATGLSAGKREEQRNIHVQLAKTVRQWMKHQFTWDLLMRVQQGTVSPVKEARVVVHDNPILGFRMLSLLRMRGATSEAKAIANLLAPLTDIATVARWSQMEPYLGTPRSLDPPPQLKRTFGEMTKLVSIISAFLADGWSRPKFPVEPNYISNFTKIPAVRNRWFITVVGGMTATELEMCRTAAALIRPDDEFVFITTDVMSPSSFMRKVLYP